MTIVQEYKRIIERIAIQESQLMTARRDLKKNMDIYKPADSKAITYDQERVQTSMHQQSIFVTANNIWVLTDFIKEVEEELEELRGQKKKLEDTINDLGDTKKQVMMYRIKGYSLSEIADKMNYSKRHIERMMAGIKKEVGEMSV